MGHIKRRTLKGANDFILLQFSVHVFLNETPPFDYIHSITSNYIPHKVNGFKRLVEDIIRERVETKKQ